MVHGPLLATYLAELIRAQSADRVIGGFEFRFTKPVFVGDEIRVQGTPVDGGADLAVVSGGDAVHAAASARYADRQLFRRGDQAGPFLSVRAGKPAGALR